MGWIKGGYATYINKKKALSFLSHQSAPIAAAAAKEELDSVAKVIKDFQNPSVGLAYLIENRKKLAEKNWILTA